VKRCPRCGQTKPLDAFVRNRASRDGLGSYCRPCHNEIGRVNLERRWGAQRFYHLKNRYGLTRAAFQELWKEQSGKCAICLTRPAAHVDHDHATGRVRGLLCFNCNGGLGHFGDDPMRLAVAIAYLHRPAPKATETSTLSFGGQG
jgi:hypothetical protein